MHQELLEIGLTRNEARIYSILIELGKAQAGILSRKTGVHRRSVYDALERLIEKGLVSFIKENDKRFYLSTNPHRLKEIVDDKQKQIYHILPEMEAQFSAVHLKQETLFYRGVDGVKTILEDQIHYGKNVYVMGGSKDATNIIKFYVEQYTEKRIKKKIKLYIIYSGEYKKAKRIPFLEVRFLPKSFATPVATNIYGDNVAIIIWSLEPVAILIRNRDVAQSYKNYFDLLWKIAKR